MNQNVFSWRDGKGPKHSSYGVMLLGILVLGWAQLAGAQNSIAQHSITQLFEKPQKIQWIKHFKGRMDDLNDVSISLAFDGKNCRGQLVYLRSKAQFDLVGFLKKGKLQLQEFDYKGRLTGHLDGEIKPQGLIANWTNYNQQIGGQFRLAEVDREATVPTYCGDNKWIRAYKGMVGKEKVELILQKEGDHRLSGNIYFKSKDQTYNVQGHMDLFDNVYLTLKDDWAQVRGKMEGTFGDRQKFNLTFSYPEGKENICTFNLKSKWAIGCVEYADYAANYNILYPKLKNAAFNQWMEQMTNDWVAQCKEQSTKVSAKVEEPSPSMRAIVRASAWVNIDYLSSDLISGLLTSNQNWKDHQSNKTIVYDLKKERAVQLVDIFKSDFDYRNFLRRQLNKSIANHQFYKDFAFREWLSKEDFAYFSVRKEGIRFCTRFHPIYGQQQMTIAYSKLKPFVKTDGPIDHLLDY
ncbi:MAG: hypothetical protein AAF985_04235 [Bacteroidota bacterium]